MIKPTTSLAHFFKMQSVRWAVVGFILTALFAVPCLLYSAKRAAEAQLFVTTKATARAFRSMILEDDNVRDAEIKMRSSLDLKSDESAVIRSPDLKAIYPMENTDNTPKCRTPGGFCWAD